MSDQVIDTNRTRGSDLIGNTVADSTPNWTGPQRPAPHAPNIVVVLLDDMGWSDFGCFGSEIATPTIDSLAASGLRMTNFHVTPLCSPTRASLLTAKNHHSVGMRFLAVTDTGFPNSRGELPEDIATIPGLLKERGYGTYLAGKWHLAPQKELSPAGPHGNWPLARGFERFYGFLGGASDQYLPELYQDNSPVPAPEDPEYHLSSDLVDRSIGYLRDHAAFRPEDPFYLQLAFGATHAPFQAPKEYIDRYRGRFDAGWEHTRRERLARQKTLGIVPEPTELTEQDRTVPDWESLSQEERQLAARGQEAYAGFLEHTDKQLERLVDWLRESGQWENTIIAVFSDNGAAGDGGRLGTTNVVGPYNNLSLPIADEMAGLEEIGDRDHPAHYATGWAMASNTPFRLFKQYVDLGGVRSPLVIHWPERIADGGGSRDHYLHVVDLAASFLDCGIHRDDPERDGVLEMVDGLPFLGVLDVADAPSPRRTQVYEMLGHRAIWHEGWKATTRHIPGNAYENDVWRLYNTEADFSESKDLAAAHPQRLKGLISLWWQEARGSGMLPLDDRTLKELLGVDSPGAATLRSTLVLRPGQSHLGFTSRLTGTQRSMVVDARLVDRSAGDEGVILASGTGYGGYVLYLRDDRLEFEHHFLGEHVASSSTRTVPRGNSVVGFRLRRVEGRSAELTLTIDGVGSGELAIPTTSTQHAFYGLDVGRDPGGQVSTAYDAGSFAFPDRVLRDVAIRFLDDPGDLDLIALHAEANQ